MGNITASMTCIIPLEADTSATTMLAVLPTASMLPSLLTSKVAPNSVSIVLEFFLGTTLLDPLLPSVT